MSRHFFPYPRFALLLGLALNLLVWTVTAAQAATFYKFERLDVPGATQTESTSINNNGQVTGIYTGIYTDGRILGFIYSNGAFTTLDMPGTTGINPTSINDSGQVVGYYSDNVGGHGFVYSNGTFATLEPSGTNYTYAASINASGQVAGYYFDSADSRYRGFVYSNGTFTTLDAPGSTNTFPSSINDSGQVTGNYRDSAGRRYGFIYSNGTFMAFGVLGVEPTSINNSGQVTGEYPIVDIILRRYDGFIYSNGTFTILYPPDSSNTWATSINDSGQVTGSYAAGINRHGFVYSNGAFTTLDHPSAIYTERAIYTEPTSINNSGQVTGCYSDSTGTHGFVATPEGQVQFPEIDVLGNNTSISNEDTTPSTTDDTDFGSVQIGDAGVSHTFTVANTGTAALTLTGTPQVALTGTTSDFTVTTQPSSPVAGGSTTTFKIQFNPTATGARQATVSIANNDSDENPYTFTIRGSGTAANNPPIAKDDSYSTPPNQKLTVPAPGVLANDDANGNTTLTVTQISGPSHGALNLQSDGGFVYTPNTDFVGQDTFTYQVTGSTAAADQTLSKAKTSGVTAADGISDPATVTITISAEIPTLSEWAQMAAAALLTLLGWLGLRRRTPD